MYLFNSTVIVDNGYQIRCSPINITHTHGTVSFVRASCITLIAICAQSENKTGKALLYFTQESKTLYHSQTVTLLQLNMHHRCRYCNIDNVAVAKENTNETFEALTNLNSAPTIASRAIHKEKTLSSVSGAVGFRSKAKNKTKNKTKTNKQKTLKSKHFLHSYRLIRR